MWDIQFEIGTQRGQMHPDHTYWWLDNETLVLPGEKWKPITAGPILTVSTLGRVYDIRKERFIKPKPLNRHQQGQFYMSFKHTYMNKSMYFTGHRVVASAWLPNPQGLPCVNHRNNDPLDNALENLEWTTVKENCLHASKAMRAARRQYVKLSKEDLMDIHRRYLLEGVSVGQLAREYQVRPTRISRLLRGVSYPGLYDQAQQLYNAAS